MKGLGSTVDQMPEADDSRFSTPRLETLSQHKKQKKNQILRKRRDPVIPKPENLNTESLHPRRPHSTSITEKKQYKV